MKNIAFVSYEYPPDTGFGGIATYVYQIANAFAKREIKVFVVCGTKNKSTFTQTGNLAIFKIHSKTQSEFHLLAPKKLAEIHNKEKLEIIEVPDFGGDGLNIKKHMPDVPLIVKLHTPTYLVKKLNNYYYYKRWYKKYFSFRKYNCLKDPEYLAAIQANYILSPSHSLKKIISEDWKIEPAKIFFAPNPYIPKEDLYLQAGTRKSNIVLYIGRLETRKGVYNLAKAIPDVIKEVPDVHFVFVGSDTVDPYRKPGMKSFLTKILQAQSQHVTFIDHVPLEQISDFYKDASVCIFPSIWENFPNVCLEAMSAGKIIIASKNGGMYEMLTDINGGIIVDPHQTSEIAAACITALNDKKLYAEMGRRAQIKVTAFYGDTLITKLLELYDNLSKGITSAELKLNGQT